jgi:FKBP-type peptidyl-prolyl cis-trans isomerase
LRSRAGIGFALVAALAACGGDSPTEVVFQVIEDTEFAASLGIDLADFTELPEGVWIRDVTLGTGDPFAAGGEATINYTGWLSNGTQFDAGDGFTFPDPFGRPIPGLEIGLDGTLVDGVRVMIIPADLAYGARGAVNPNTGAVVIPGGAIVIFEVELVALTD